MQELIAKFLPALLTGALLMLLFNAISRRTSSDKNRAATLQYKTIAPSKLVYGGIAAICFIAALLAGFAGRYLAQSSSGEDRFAIWAIFWVFFLGTLLMLQYLSPRYRVKWTDTTISGPASRKIIPFGPGQADINFSDIVSIQDDLAGHTFLTDHAGKRIYFSYLYPGFNILLEEILKARSDLALNGRNIRKD